jgi:hypothetical protein
MILLLLELIDCFKFEFKNYVILFCPIRLAFCFYLEDPLWDEALFFKFKLFESLNNVPFWIESLIVFKLFNPALFINDKLLLFDFPF